MKEGRWRKAFVAGHGKIAQSPVFCLPVWLTDIADVGGWSADWLVAELSQL